MAIFGNFVFGPGGVDNYVFAIDDAAGTAGPSPDALGHVSGWGLVKSTDQFTWTATPAAPLTVALETLVNPTTVGVDVPGPMDHFDPTQAYTWPAVEWAGALQRAGRRGRPGRGDRIRYKRVCQPGRRRVRLAGSTRPTTRFR